MDDIIANVHVDDQLAPYRTFFDHQWASEIVELVSDTKLVPVVASLALHWKSIANAHLMPWLVCESLSNFAAGFLGVRPPIDVAVVRAIQQRLVNELGDAISRRGAKTLQSAVDRIARSALEASAAAAEVTRYSFQPADFWLEFLSNREFQLSIVGSQRLCYAGVYFAYENFVRQCTSVATGVPESVYQRCFRTQLNDMEATFGHDVTERLADARVNVARLIRNSLVHAGGRISDELRQVPHGLSVEKGVLQIKATDTARLFHQLKARVSCLAERAVTLPVIKAPAPLC
jgi:hypothetical protein